MTDLPSSPIIPLMHTIVETSSWDIIEAVDGSVVVTLPPMPLPRCALVAADAIYIGTSAATFRLAGSSHLSGIVAGARAVVIAEADDMIRRETAVDIRTTAMAFAPIGEEDEQPGRRIAA